MALAVSLILAAEPFLALYLIPAVGFFHAPA